MRTLAVCVMVLTGVSVEQADSRDAAVYQAVLEHTLRPQAQKYGAPRGVAPPEPLLLVNQTNGICSGRPRTPRVGCVSQDSVRAFEGTHPRANVLLFAGLIDQQTRQNLANALRSRNAASAPLRGEGLRGMKLVKPEELPSDLRHVAGFSTFSLPVYDGSNALVYTSFTCGGLCGYGWFVLLEQRDGGWHVLANHVMWIS